MKSKLIHTLFILFTALSTIYGQTPENVMYVWYGDNDLRDADFVATVNFDPNSANYGKVISVSPLKGTGAKGNEPHHIGIVKETNQLVVGGLLSLLKNQDEVFFYNISNPLNPVYTRSFNVPMSSTTDEFLSLPNGNFLVTMMGGMGGGQPGRVAEFDKNGKLLAEWPVKPPATDFNPHGISVRPERDLMVTCDFVNPISTITGDLMFPNKVRVWKLSNRTITKTISLPDAGATMDIQLVPKDPQERAILPGFSGKLWLIDTKNGTAKSIYDFKNVNPATPVTQPHIVKFSKDGKRMFISLYASGQVVMFDCSNIENPKLLSVANLGAKAGIHYIRLSDDETRIVASGYFLNQRYGTNDAMFPNNPMHTQAVGVVEADGDRKIHVINIKNNKLERDTRFSLDGNITFKTGPARPHGFIFNYSKELDKIGTCDGIKGIVQNGIITFSDIPSNTAYIQVYNKYWQRSQFTNGFRYINNGKYQMPLPTGSYIVKLGTVIKNNWCERTFYFNVVNNGNIGVYSAIQSVCNEASVDLTISSLPSSEVYAQIFNPEGKKPSMDLGKISVVDSAINVSIPTDYNLIKLRMLKNGVWQEKQYTFGTCGSVESLNDLVTLFPNPADDFINVDFSAYENPSDDMPIDISVVNSIGQVVKQDKVYTAHEKVYHLVTSDLAPGLYYFHADLKNKRPFYKPFVVGR